MKPGVKLILILFLHSPILSLAQPDLKKYGRGYIVTNTNDTLHGYIKRFKETQPKFYYKVFFSNDSLVETKYKPGDIKAFSLDSSVYVSKMIYGVLKNYPYFMKVIIKGKISLYSTVESSGGGGGMMYMGGGGAPASGVWMGGGGGGNAREYFIETSSEFNKVLYNKEFKKHLRDVFKDCTAIDIKDKPKDFDITELVKTYNNCTGK